MYKVKFVKPIKTTNDIYSRVKQAYIDDNIPVPYPAANKQLQLRLTQFVSKGLSNEQSSSFFDKVNSNRVYALEKHNDSIRLMMLIKEKDETKKLIVLPIDEEIQVIVSSFIHVFEQTGFIESAPKCHKRLHDVYAISDKRIRIVQRTLSKCIASALHNDENKDVQNKHFENEDNENEDNENEDYENKDNKDVSNNNDDRYSNVLRTNKICNNGHSTPSLSHESITTRSKSKLNKKQDIKTLKRTNAVEPDQKKKKIFKKT